MDLEHLLTELNIPFKRPGEHHHATSNRVQIDCPYCSKGSGHFRLGIHRSGRYASCWTCGVKGVATALAEAAGELPRMAREALRKLEPYQSPINNPERLGALKLPQGIGPMRSAHRKYLRGRGFCPEQLNRLWGVQGIGGNGRRLAWRLFLPLTLAGKTVSWTTRALTDGGARYWTAKPDEEIISSKRLLLGEEYARHSIIVVEGPMDAYRIGPGAVATLGTMVTGAQVAKIAAYPQRYIAFDNEPDAQKRASALCDALESLPGETYRLTLDAKDAAECSEQEIQQLRNLLR